MRIGCSTTPGVPLASEAPRLAALGFDFVEWSLTLADAEATAPRDVPLAVESAHLPDVDFSDAHLAKCVALVDLASATGARRFVLHAVSRALETAGNEARKGAWLVELQRAAAQKGATLALEHTDEDVATMSRLLDHAPGVGFCLDTGHANLFSPESRADEFVDAFADRLVEVHLSDNLGGASESDDLHLPLGDGNVRFAPIFRHLRGANWSGPLVVEVFHGGYDDRARGLALARRLSGGR